MHACVRGPRVVLLGASLCSPPPHQVIQQLGDSLQPALTDVTVEWVLPETAAAPADPSPAAATPAADAAAAAVAEFAGAGVSKNSTGAAAPASKNSAAVPSSSLHAHALTRVPCPYPCTEWVCDRCQAQVRVVLRCCVVASLSVVLCCGLADWRAELWRDESLRSMQV